jgi:hypothetical protein
MPKKVRRKAPAQSLQFERVEPRLAMAGDILGLPVTFASYPAAQAATEDAEGSSYSGATNIGAFGLRKSLTACADFTEDRDYFKFTAQRAGIVRMVLSTLDPLRTQFRRYYADGSSRLVDGFVLSVGVKAGQTITFNVRALEGSGDYKMNFRLTPNTSSLGEVDCTTLRDQSISSEKWYKLSSLHEGNLRSEAWVDRSTNDVRLELYDAKFQKLATSSGRYKDDLTTDSECGEVFYVRVAGSNRDVKLRFTSGELLAASSTYYVATGGLDTNDGSLASPFATLEKAIALALPGDTIYVRGGTYHLAKQITIGDADGDNIVYAPWGEGGRHGLEGAPIRLLNYPGETPILDGAAFAAQPGNAGLRINANWWHVRGLTIQHTNYAFSVSGANNILENCVGRWSTGGGFGIAAFYDRPTNDNLFLNCDAYENFDPSLPAPGNNADGFVLGDGVDEGNIFRGCRAWGNSDDGWDLINAETSITLEDCWAYDNGYNIFGADQFFGSGVGFKLGYENAAPVSHLLIRCVAWENAANGFMYVGTTPQRLYNCTSYDNGHDNGVEKSDQANYVFNNAASIFRNCISFVSPQAGDAFTTDANDAYNTFSKVGRQDLAAFWGLDSLADAQGTSNFTINQGVTFAPGKIGNGAVFERANRDYLQAPDSAATSMGAGESFTIFARVKLTDKNTFQVFLAKGDPLTTNPAGLEYALVYNNVADAIQFRVSNGSTEYVMNAGIGSPQANTWYTLECSFSAATHELRVHANAGGSPAMVINGFVQDGTNPLRLGRDSTSNRYLNGMVDDVAIFNRVLTAEERMRYWNNGDELPYDVWATAPFGGHAVDEGDFLSLDATIAEGARQADGSLPVSGFLRPTPNSSLVDAGVNVGYAFNGAAPDLGAFET